MITFPAIAADRPSALTLSVAAPAASLVDVEFTSTSALTGFMQLFSVNFN
jgi:hypothetical protein